MILNVTGGSYQYETMPYINYKEIKNSDARWVQGYSDTTHITFLLTTICDVASIYGNGLSEFGYNNLTESAVNNLELLKGENLIQHSYSKYGKIKNEDDMFETPKYEHDVKWKSLKGEKE